MTETVDTHPQPTRSDRTRPLTNLLGGVAILGSVLAGVGLTASLTQEHNLFESAATAIRAIATPRSTTMPDGAIHVTDRQADSLAPTPEALDGLFEIEENLAGLTTPPLPDNPPRSSGPALTPLEAQINRILLEQIDPPGPFLALRKKMLDAIPNSYPVEFKGVTSRYGMRVHPTTNSKEFHHGIDLRAAMNTPVRATADGVVEFAGHHGKSGFGNVVIIHHSYGFRTTYAHMGKVQVKFGQFIRKGEQIGVSGNSGLSNGPHLHYEVRFIHRKLNPMPFMAWSQDNYQALFKEKNVDWPSLMRLIAQRVNEPVLPPLWLAEQHGEVPPLGMDLPKAAL